MPPTDRSKTARHWLLPLLALAVGILGMVAVWLAAYLHFRTPSGWLALVAALDIALMLRLAAAPAGRLRAGLAVDQSPTNNTDRSPRIPTGDRTIVSLGTAWSPNDDVTIDLAYSYLMEDDAHIERDDYSATYKNTAHGLGAQVTYRF